MPTRSLPLLLAALLLGPWPAAACAGEGDPPARPNLLLLLTDDQRFDTLGATGNELVATPHLDRLAREGVLFESAVVPTALCCPARASLLTGLWPHQTGVFNNQPEPGLLERHELFPERLQRAGYETAWIGKWHLPDPGGAPVRGFDHWVSFEGQGEHWDQPLNVDGEVVPTEGFSADVLTDRALAFLARERERPFFLALSLKNLHKPYEPPPRHAGRLDGVPIPLPDSAGDPPESLPEHVRRWRERETPRTEKLEAGTLIEELRGYHELLLSVDDNLGRVLAALERSGELDRTLVLATSDHGFLWGEHGLFMKRIAYEPAIRVPLVARLPGLARAGARETRIASSLDLAPTFLELAGAEPPEGLAGRSLVPLLRGDDVPWRDATLHHDAFQPRFPRPTELALRTPRWKYLCGTEPERGEGLFDRQRDPGERVDLARDPDHAQVLADLRARLLQELEAIGAPAEWIEQARATHAAAREAAGG